MQFLTDNILLIYVLPLIAVIVALTSYFFRFSVSRNSVKIISLISNIVALIFSSALLYMFMANPAEPAEAAFRWLNIGSLSVYLGFFVDKFAALYLFCLMLVGLVVQIISVKLLREDEKQELFYAFLNMLMLTMTAFVLSQNVIQSVLLSVISGFIMFLSLNLNFEKYNVSKYAQKFIMVDKFGDFCLLSSVVIFLYFITAYELNFSGELLCYSSLTDIISDVYVYMSDMNFLLLCSLFLAGLFAKTGIFPFHSKYLVSSYEHSPAYYLTAFSMAVTGGLLTYRMFPAFDFSDKLVLSVFVIFAISILYCIVSGLLNKFFLKNDYSNIVYSIIGSIFLILPFTMTSHSDSPNTENRIYWFIFIFTVFFIFYVISDIIIYLRNPEKSQNFATSDIVDRTFDFIVDNILDIPRNIVRVTDKYIIPVFENIIVCFTKFLAWIISFMQNGKIQSYIMYILVFMSLMLILFLFLQVGEV